MITGIYNAAIWVVTVAIIADVIVLLPLSAIPRLRAITGYLIMASGWMFMVAAWGWCILLTYLFFGTGVTVASLTAAFIGVIPAAMVALAIHGNWGGTFEIIGALVFSVAVVFAGYAISARYRHGSRHTALVT